MRKGLILRTLEWNSFDRYPGQGEDIYVYVHSVDGLSHRFVEIKNFNAVNFSPLNLIHSKNDNCRWMFSWLPSEEARKGIEEFMKE